MGRLINIIKESKVIVLNLTFLVAFKYLAWILIRSTTDYLTENNNWFAYNQQRKGCAKMIEILFKSLSMLMTKQNLCFYHHWLMNKHIYHWLINKQILHAYSVSLVNNESLAEIIKTALDFIGYKSILQFNLPHTYLACQWICRIGTHKREKICT